MYLSFRIDKLSVQILENKVAHIKIAAVPTNIKQLQSILGLISYYGS